MNITLDGLRKKLNIGFVGYCPPTRFDERKALDLIKKAFNTVMHDYPDVKYFNLISGVTNVGTLKLAYSEAECRGWSISGVACKKAQDYEWYPGLRKENVYLIGDDWGDEIKAFTDMLDVMVRVGGGKQSLDECKRLKDAGKTVYECELEKIVDERSIEKM